MIDYTACPAKVMDAKDALPDAGSYQCAVTGGKNDATLHDVTLLISNGNRIGLYDSQGKAVSAE